MAESAALLVEEVCSVAKRGLGEKGRVESRHPATVEPTYLLPPLSFGGASIAGS
jgi:hypothetical protein